jgi:disulfide bond formation protein DsbB
MIKHIKDNLLYVAWITAVASMVGSLYYGEILGLVPCSLCWYQRILMYPLVLIIGLGIIKKDRHFYDYALPLSAIGSVIAIYQNLLYYNVIQERLLPCTFGTSCISRYISVFGFIDIPLMALFASIIITATLLIHKKHVQRS